MKKDFGEDVLMSVVQLIKGKISLKIKLFHKAVEWFKELEEEAQNLLEDIKREVLSFNNQIKIELIKFNEFQFRIRIGGETLVVAMHSNIHQIPTYHYFWNLQYLKDNPLNGFCALIYFYNFLNDSFLYNRTEDTGELIARMYVNHEKHFFVEGKHRMDFLYTEFDKQILTRDKMKEILIQALFCSLSSDLTTPELGVVMKTTVGAIQSIIGSSYFSTGKKIGFRLHRVFQE